MNCLCCGKQLPKNSNSVRWHKTCIKRFFGTKDIPEIDISNNTMELLVTKSVNKRTTIPGVQKKISLQLVNSEKNKSKLTLIDYPTGYILKPQVKDFFALPEAEHLVMCMADKCGISTVPHALLRGENDYVYITKRVDRVIENNEPVKMLAMEDFCQLDLRLTKDKYRGSYERCAKIISRYSTRFGLDLSELYLRLVFSFITGNSDMHLKNFSLIETYEGSEKYILSPAYDLLPINIIMPEDKEEFALAMNGKKRNIHRNDFLIFAKTIDINAKSAKKMLDKMISLHSHLEKMILESLLPKNLKEDFTKLITNRVNSLK